MDELGVLARFTAGGVRAAFEGCPLAGASEARVREGKPLSARVDGKERFIAAGGFVREAAAYRPTAQDIAECLDVMGGHSLYARADELRGGYLTLPGGHRVGVCGKAAVEGGLVKTIKRATGLNIRLAHEIRGCGAAALPLVWGCHTMIVSPPGCGKTTLLRDIARLMSNAGQNVVIVDERAEIAGGGYLDVGPRTDVLDGCPKAAGMWMAIRAMGPDVLAVDEIGGEADAAAIEEAAYAGVAVLCTAHGRDIADIRRKPALRRLEGVFERYLLLSNRDGAGTVEGVYGAGFTEISPPPPSKRGAVSCGS